MNVRKDAKRDLVAWRRLAGRVETGVCVKDEQTGPGSSLVLFSASQNVFFFFFFLFVAKIGRCRTAWGVGVVDSHLSLLSSPPSAGSWKRALDSFRPLRWVAMGKTSSAAAGRWKFPHPSTTFSTL